VRRNGQCRRVVRRAAAVSRERRSRTRAPPRRGPRRRSGGRLEGAKKGVGERKDAPVRGGTTRGRRGAPATYLDRDRQRERGLGLGLGLAILGRLALGGGGRLVAHRAMRSGASAGPRRAGQRQMQNKKIENPRAPRADRVRFEHENLTGQSETGVSFVSSESKSGAGKGRPARDIAGIQAPNHRPSHAPPSTQWPLLSTPPSPRASPPPRCVSIRRGPIARASRARFRGGPREHRIPLEPANIQTARAQNVSDPVLRASPPSTARRRPPHLLRQGRRRHRPRAVRLTPDRSRARGPFPATVRDVICCGSRSVERGALGGPNARPREGRPSGAPVRSAPCGRVAPRPRHARGDGTSDARAPLPRRSTPRGPSIAPRRGSNVATVKHASRMIAATASLFRTITHPRTLNPSNYRQTQQRDPEGVFRRARGVG